MKIAISAEGPTLEDDVDPRFGRAAGFIIYDTETKAVEYIENGAGQTAAQGAGLIAVETVSNAGATVALSGYIGPKGLRCAAGDRHRHRPGRRQPHGGRSRPRLRGGRAHRHSSLEQGSLMRILLPAARAVRARPPSLRASPPSGRIPPSSPTPTSRRPTSGSTSRTRSPRKRPWGSRYPCVLRTPATSAANARRSASSMPSRSSAAASCRSPICATAAADVLRYVLQERFFTGNASWECWKREPFFPERYVFSWDVQE